MNPINERANENPAEELPEIKPAQPFRFRCGPDNPCFNRCCAELALPLTPYDTARLRRNLGVTGADFLRAFTDVRSYPGAGFPMPMLKMIESPDAPCPFVTPAGCSVYEDRPGACRLYPLGRGSKMTPTGLAETFYIVREEKCMGFDAGKTQTPAEWSKIQDADIYNRFNDRYMKLIGSRLSTAGPLDDRSAALALVCLYQPEHFKMLIEKMNLFDRLGVNEENRAIILEDSPAGDEALLNFALDWLEIALLSYPSNPVS